MDDLANWIIVPICVWGLSVFGLIFSPLERDEEEFNKIIRILGTSFLVSTLVLVLWVLFLPTN